MCLPKYLLANGHPGSNSVAWLLLLVLSVVSAVSVVTIISTIVLLRMVYFVPLMGRPVRWSFLFSTTLDLHYYITWTHLSNTALHCIRRAGGRSSLLV